MPGRPAAHRRAPDATALVDDTRVFTWRQVNALLDRVTGALLHDCREPRQRVAVVGDNVAETLLVHAAGIRVGVGTVALAKGLSPGEITDQVRDAAARTVVTGPRQLEAVVAASRRVPGVRVVLHGAEVPSAAAGAVTAWDDWLALDVPAQVRGRSRPADPPLVYTSGTTGRPRGSHVRWATLTGTSQDYLLRLNDGFPGPWGPHLVVGPLQHNGPLTSVRNLLAGSPVVVLGRFDPSRVLELVETWKVESTVMVPTHFQRLLALPEAQRSAADCSSLVQVAHTGSACPAEVKRAMIAWWGPVLVESYGGTECGTVARITSQEWLQRPGSVGRAVPPFRVVAVDEHGRDLPAGETGVLAVVAPAHRRVVYLGDPAKTASVYVRPDAFTLGDVGRVDDEGYVWITDRVSDMVLSGGVNLYPAESENALADHPKVCDVAVIGVPDADLGERLLALVVPADTADPPSQAELDRWCRDRIASYKCPKSYELVDTLARNAMNKLDKRALRAPYWAGERTIAG